MQSIWLQQEAQQYEISKTIKHVLKKLGPTLQLSKIQHRLWNPYSQVYDIPTQSELPIN